MQQHELEHEKDMKEIRQILYEAMSERKKAEEKRIRLYNIASIVEDAMKQIERELR